MLIGKSLLFKSSPSLGLYLSLLLTVCIVFPNSFQILSFLLLSSYAAYCAVRLRFDKQTTQLLILLGAGTLVTIFYLLIGVMRGASSQALYEISYVYIVSPLCWIIIASYSFHKYGKEVFVEFLGTMTICCGIFITLFYLAYFAGKVSYFEIFKENINVNVGLGSATATLHIFGSLLFLSPAFVAAPELIENKLKRTLVIMSAFGIPLVSGRDGLVLVVLAAVVFNLLLPSKLNYYHKVNSFMSKIRVLVVIIVGLFILLPMLWFAMDISISTILSKLFDKVQSAGGEIRQTQSEYLWEGINNNYGLGSGLGIGLDDFVRNDPERPWRYEMLVLSVPFSVGIVGAFIYVLPFILFIFNALKKLFFNSNFNSYDKFFLVGLISFLIATLTNPYILSFNFQWMAIFPLLYNIQPKGSGGYKDE